MQVWALTLSMIVQVEVCFAMVWASGVRFPLRLPFWFVASKISFFFSLPIHLFILFLHLQPHNHHAVINCIPMDITSEELTLG
jgi:hypothetical protein